MGKVKDKSIQSLLKGLEDFENGKKPSSNNNSKTLKTLMEEYLNTPSKRQREKMAEEFKARRKEFAEFLKNNPELIVAEAKNALISAAVGGQYADEEIEIDTQGRKRVKRTTKQAAPNVAAIIKLLELEGDNMEMDDDGFLDAISGKVGDVWQKE